LYIATYHIRAKPCVMFGCICLFALRSVVAVLSDMTACCWFYWLYL